NDYSYASAIGNTGQVVGWSHVPSPNDWHAFIWDSTNGMQDLGPPDVYFSEAHGINDLGVVVGRARIVDVGDVAVLWDEQGMTELGALPAVLSESEARNVNNLGQVVGVSLYDNEECYSCLTAFLWEAGEMTDLGRFVCQDCVSSEANAINDAGQIVGDAWVAWSTPHACMWRDGAMIDLNDVIPSGSGWTLVSATGISEDGRIVGYGYVGEDMFDYRAFLLTPVNLVPTTSEWGVVTMALVLLGAGTIVLGRRPVRDPRLAARNGI
ncbi:MAG: IPTL-CTERM sorting domain-containing protein, partial [Phycisphaerae bacterium]